jgi:hypothetical protein
MDKKFRTLFDTLKNNITVMKDKALWQTGLQELVLDMEVLLQEMEKAPTWYVVVPDGGGMDGEQLEVYEAEKEALQSCREQIDQQITDHHRHNLPLKVTPEIERRFDLRLFQTQGELELPFQEWVDDYYQQQQDWKKEREEQEYLRYLELKAKYENEGE